MAAFEKAVLLNGEFRTDYIRKRVKEGASTQAIVEEINHPDLYSGAAGSRWSSQIVYQERAKLASKKAVVETAPEPKAKLKVAAPEPEPEPKAKLKVAAPEPEPEPKVKLEAAAKMAVPEEYEGILDEEDVAQVYAEAQKAIDDRKRKAARKALLIKAREDLERNARDLELAGMPKGDMVDVVINVAPYAAISKEATGLRIDGRTFEHGQMYRVTRAVAKGLMEQMQWSWRHEASLRGGAHSLTTPLTLNMSSGMNNHRSRVRA